MKCWCIGHLRVVWPLASHSHSASLHQSFLLCKMREQNRWSLNIHAFSVSIIFKNSKRIVYLHGFNINLNEFPKLEPIHVYLIPDIFTPNQCLYDNFLLWGSSAASVNLVTSWKTKPSFLEYLELLFFKNFKCIY